MREMVDAETLRKAQLKMVDILVEIDRVCIKHNIKYWLMYGTLLGAVRHRGFIPWDDDCDICMMRDDYERFIKVASKDLPDFLFVQNNETDKYYPRSMTKVRMNGTKVVSFDEDENEKYHQGIFVDIFIWDYYHPVIKNIVDNIKVVNEWKFKRKKYPKGSLKRVALQVGVALPYLLYSTIMKFLICISVLSRKNIKHKNIGQRIKATDACFYEKNYIFPLKREIDFEGKYFYVPNNSDVVLTQKYGDYMTLPKVEDRRWHAKKIEVNL